MAEILANLSDINTHLPPNVRATEALTDIQVDAQRLIRGQLTAIFSSTIISEWDKPDDTPELIRGIAGRLIASKYYARLVSQESADELPGYASGLYLEAIGMLTAIKSGALIITDDNGDEILGTDLGPDPQGDVFPNDSSTPPFFTVDRVYS